MTSQRARQTGRAHADERAGKARGSRWRRGLFLVGVCVATGVLLLPAIVAFTTSVKPESEIFSTSANLLPQHPTIDSYRKLFSIPEFGQYMLNSLIVAGFTALVTVTASLLAAYALRFLRFRGRRFVSQTILMTYMFPAITLIIPLFFLAQRLGIINTHLALILADLTVALPISIWLMNGFLEAFPDELERAARVDGCSRLQVIRYVVLPLTSPGIVAIGAFAFILAWGEYLFSITLSLTTSSRTASAGLHSLMGNYRVDYGLLTAASVVIVLPVIVLFTVFQRYIVEGLTADSLKA